MKPESTSKLLAAVCIVQLLAFVWLMERRTGVPVAPVLTVASPTAVEQPQPRSERPGAAPVEAGSPQGDLARHNQELETALAEAKKELEAYKSRISVPYGPPRQAGRFVGRTFRKMFEAAAAQDPGEAQQRTAENQIGVYSLGPFIQMAESIEGDPALFAQFQGSLIGEVLELPTQRDAEVEAVLADFSARSLKTETGSPEWGVLNDAALQKITALLPEEQKQAMQERLKFFQRYGVLMIPAYSILRAPTPTVAEPAVQMPDPGSGK